jgi:hypothetical protein
MKKISLSFVILSTLFFFSCEEKKTDTPTNNTVPTSTYYIKANINGEIKTFTNLTVYRNETPGDVSLLIVANNTISKNPKFEFNIQQPVAGWSNSMNYNINQLNLDFVKYTNADGKVYSTRNNNADLDSLNIKFNSFSFVKDGLINANMNGTIAYDQDLTKIIITDGILKLKAD